MKKVMMMNIMMRKKGVMKKRRQNDVNFNMLNLQNLIIIRI